MEDNLRKCPVCGEEIEVGKNICKGCGAIISSLDENKEIRKEFPNRVDKNTTVKVNYGELFDFHKKEKTFKEESLIPPWIQDKPKSMPFENMEIKNRELDYEEKLPFFLFKSRIACWILDFLLIFFIWLGTQVIASFLLRTSIFKLISKSYPSLIIFFFLLLGVYLFLFILFFKQTFGEFILSRKT